MQGRKHMVIRALKRMDPLRHGDGTLDDHLPP
jgi:hypothetical protein